MASKSATGGEFPVAESAKSRGIARRERGAWIVDFAMERMGDVSEKRLGKGVEAKLGSFGIGRRERRREVGRPVMACRIKGEAGVEGGGHGFSRQEDGYAGTASGRLWLNQQRSQEQNEE